MTSKDYNEYTNYYMYLKQVIREQEVYLPNVGMKILAIKLYENLKNNVIKQYTQLKSVFNYRYFRYLLKEGDEE